MRKSAERPKQRHPRRGGVGAGPTGGKAETEINKCPKAPLGQNKDDIRAGLK